MQEPLAHQLFRHLLALAEDHFPGDRDSQLRFAAILGEALVPPIGDYTKKPDWNGPKLDAEHAQTLLARPFLQELSPEESERIKGLIHRSLDSYHFQILERWITQSIRRNKKWLTLRNRLGRLQRFCDLGFTGMISCAEREYEGFVIRGLAEKTDYEIDDITLPGEHRLVRLHKSLCALRMLGEEMQNCLKGPSSERVEAYLCSEEDLYLICGQTGRICAIFVLDYQSGMVKEFRGRHNDYAYAHGHLFFDVLQQKSWGLDSKAHGHTGFLVQDGRCHEILKLGINVIRENLKIVGTKQEFSLPNPLKVAGTLELYNCKNLCEIPPLEASTVYIRDCPSILFWDGPFKTRSLVINTLPFALPRIAEVGQVTIHPSTDPDHECDFDGLLRVDKSGERHASIISWNEFVRFHKKKMESLAHRPQRPAHERQGDRASRIPALKFFL